jgi:toxin ParE1/3/4
MKLDFRITSPAQDDIDAILDVSEERWGPAARDRYESIIAAALRQIAADPGSVTSRERRTLQRGMRSLHLKVVSANPAVRSPVHVIFYKVTSGSIEIVRVLHERMHVTSQLHRR